MFLRQISEPKNGFPALMKCSRTQNPKSPDPETEQKLLRGIRGAQWPPQRRQQPKNRQTKPASQPWMRSYRWMDWLAEWKPVTGSLTRTRTRTRTLVPVPLPVPDLSVGNKGNRRFRGIANQAARICVPCESPYLQLVESQFAAGAGVVEGIKPLSGTRFKSSYS